ncbi:MULTISPECIES: hypothetical protein [unclassified Saccharopolyspora]|nr:MULTISPECIES: hypothetical protein [unclassified Saccharopolyspora]
MFDRFPEPEDLAEYPGQLCEIRRTTSPEIVDRSVQWTAAALRDG